MPRRSTNPEEWFSILLALMATIGGSIFIGYYPQYKPTEVGGGVAWAVPVWIGFFYLIIQMTFLLFSASQIRALGVLDSVLAISPVVAGLGAADSGDHQPDLPSVVFSAELARGAHRRGRVGVSPDDLDPVRSQPPHHRLRSRFIRSGLIICHVRNEAGKAFCAFSGGSVSGAAPHSDAGVVP